MEPSAVSPPQRQRKVLVTGGSGLLGRPLCSELVDRGFAVTSLSSRSFDKLHEKTQELFERKRISHIEIDLEKDVVTNRAVGLACLVEEDSFDLIINLAADRGGVTWDGVRKRMNNVILNTDLPACLSEIASRQKMRVFQISTEYVWTGHGNTDEGYPATPIGEDDRFVDAVGAPYALQKKEAEEKVKGNPLVTTIRVPVLFGPMLSELEDGTAGGSIYNFLGDNDWKHDSWQRRYPTCTLDVAFIVGALVAKLFCCGLQASVYNYGAQRSVSKYRFLALFAEAAGLPKDVREVAEEDASERPEGKRPPFDVKLDINRTRQELAEDWREPRELGLAEMTEVWLQVPVFAEAVEELRPLAPLPDEPDVLEDGTRSPSNSSFVGGSFMGGSVSGSFSRTLSMSMGAAKNPTPGY